MTNAVSIFDHDQACVILAGLQGAG